MCDDASFHRRAFMQALSTFFESCEKTKCASREGGVKVFVFEML